MPKLLWALVLSACAAAQVVEGTVSNTLTGAAIPGVKVDLTWAEATYYSTTSDAQGRFRFEHVEPADYFASYSAPGYLETDGFRPPPAAIHIQVTAGRGPIQLDAHMLPTGRLSGRVIDPRGHPVPRAKVMVSGPGVGMGADTDAEGKFALNRFGLPGAYTISAAPPPDLKSPDPEPDSGVVLGWTRTWYPGVAVAEAAQKLVMGPGGEIENIEIKLLTARAYSVRGVLLNLDGKPAGNVEIHLDGAPQPGLRAQSKADGTFEFPVVVPGQWRLSAELGQLKAGQWVDMADRDRENLKLQLSAPFTVSIRLAFEVPKDAQPPKSAPFLERADRFHGLPRGPLAFGRQETGSIVSIHPVFPDAYFLVANAPPGYYLEAVRLGDTALTSLVVDLSEGAPPITVAYKADGGSVRGTVENCGFGGVILVAQDPAGRWRGSPRPARCDANGRYDISSVRPGEYYVVATTADPYTAFWNSEWDESMVNQAARVTVRPGESSDADLRAISRPQ
jgi:Carboxypeptidase regulatory-like domain